VPAYTFEEFIQRKNKGKKHYFLKSILPRDDVMEMYKEYLDVAKAKKDKYLDERDVRIREE